MINKEAINTNKDSRCTVVNVIGTVAERNTKDGQQSLELTLTKWFNGPARYDLRWWTNGNMAGKGCAFNTTAAKALRDLLNSINFDELEE